MDGASELSYHVPPLGNVAITLRAESAGLFSFLKSSGEIGRLRRLDHLGVIRSVWDGAHHPRWEYVVSILFLIERCRDVSAVRLSSPITDATSGITISSGYELLRCWAFLLNVGHVHWTFSSERALLFEIRDLGDARRAVLDALPDDELRAWADDVINDARVYQLFQVLAFIRMRTLNEAVPAVDRLDLAMPFAALRIYLVAGEKDEHASYLRRIYRNLRRLAYLALDTHYIPSPVVLDLRDLVTSERGFANLALRDVDREEDELRALERQLYREVYMGREVLRRVASTERPLREAIRASLATNDTAATIENLATGDILEGCTEENVETVLRLAVWVPAPFDRVLLPQVNVAQEQAVSERDVAVRHPATRVIWWRAPYGSEWVLQSFSPPGELDGAVAAYDFGFAEMARLHPRLSREHAWMTEDLLQQTLFSQLADDLLLAAVRLAFERSVVWEWRGSGGQRAWFATKGAAERLLTAAASQPRLSRDRVDEFNGLRSHLPGAAATFLAVSAANLVAYDEDGSEQLAELDGVAVQSDGLGHITIILVETKRKRRGARKAAERQLKAILRTLRARRGIVGDVETEQQGTVASAWVRLELSA